MTQRYITILFLLFSVLIVHPDIKAQSTDSLFYDIELLIEEGDCEKALQKLNKIKKQSNKTPQGKAIYNYLKSLILTQDSLFDEALTNLSLALDIKQDQESNDCEYTKILHQIALCNFNKGDIEATELYLRKAIVNSDLYDLNCSKVSESYLLLMELYSFKKEYKLAEECLKKFGEEVYRYVYEDENKKVQVFDYLRHDYNRSLEYFQKAITICEKYLEEDNPSIQELYNNIGSVYSDLGEYTKAIEYHQKH